MVEDFRVVEEANRVIEVIKKHIKEGRRGLEAAPDFGVREIVFHPIPKNLQHLVKPGEIWMGEYGIKRNTGKKDIHGTPIFVQYFIPKEKVVQYEFEGLRVLAGKPYAVLREMSGEVKGAEKVLEPKFYKLGENSLLVYYDVTGKKITNRYTVNIDSREYMEIDLRIKRDGLYFWGEKVEGIKLPEEVREKVSKRLKERMLKEESMKKQMQVMEFEMIRKIRNLTHKAKEYCMHNYNRSKIVNVKYWIGYGGTPSETPLGNVGAAKVYTSPEECKYLQRALSFFDAAEKILGLRPGELSTEILEYAEESPNIKREVDILVRVLKDVLERCSKYVVIPVHISGAPPHNTVKCTVQIAKRMYIV